MKQKIGLIVLLWVQVFMSQVSLASDEKVINPNQYLGITTRAYLADELLNLANLSEYMTESNLVTSNSIIIKIGDNGAIQIHREVDDDEYILNLEIDAISEEKYGVMWEGTKRTVSFKRVYGSSGNDYQVQKIGEPLIFSIELDGKKMIFDMEARVDTDTKLIEIFEQ